MAECEFCGEVTFTNTCNQCGGDFCEQHMLPENHNCPSLLGEKVSPEWFEGGDRTQKIGGAESNRSDSEADKPHGGESNLEEQSPDQVSRAESEEIDSGDSDESDYETVDAETIGTSKEWEGNPSPDVNTDGSVATEDSPDTELKSNLLSSDSRVVSWVQSLWKRVFSVVQSLVRLLGVVTVWIGIGLILWNFATGAGSTAVLQGVAITVLGFGAVKVTNTGA